MVEARGTSSINSIDKILRDDSAGRQEQLSIEFLQNLIRQSLADFVNAQYPLLDMVLVNKYVHTAVVIKKFSLEVDTVKLADQVIQSSADDRDKLKKELSRQLAEQAKKAIGRFLHYSELRTQGTKISAKEFLVKNADRYKVSAQDLQNIYDRYKYPVNRQIDQDKLSEELRVVLGGKVWKVNLIYYGKTANKTETKTGKMILKVKQKIAEIKSKVAGKLKKIAKFLKDHGAQSMIAMELKPFLKGAVAKLKYVEKLARSTFARITEADISEMAAQSLLQNLDSELEALERYVNKVEKIFNKLKDQFIAGAEGMLEPLLLKDLEVTAEDQSRFGQHNYDRDIDWSIKKGNKDIEKIKSQIKTNSVTPQMLRQPQGRGRSFAKLFSKVLDPRKFFSQGKIKKDNNMPSGSAVKQVDLMIDAERVLKDKKLDRTENLKKYNRKYFHQFGS